MDIKLENGCVTIKLVNASTLSLTHNINNIQVETNSKNKIEQLIFTDKYRIVIGEDLEVSKDLEKHTYFVKSIIKKSNTEFEIRSTTRNKSSLFILPLIANSKNKDYMNYESYLYNSYLHFDNYNTYNDGKHIFLKYRFFSTEHFYEMEKRLMLLPTFIKSIQPDKDFTIYIFKIQDQFYPDVKLFIKGKYSHISSTAKARIILFHGIKMTDYIGQVLYKDKALKELLEFNLDCEIPENIDLLTKPNLEREKL